jgi:hypothetical protein
MTPEWTELEEGARALSSTGRFGPGTVESLPEPGARYLTASIRDGTPLAAGARLSMRGRIKIGRWLPFRARQLLVPRLGTVWEARVAGAISGSDRYVRGAGGMDWRLLGAVRLIHAAGPDVSRSAAQRAAGESIWVPTALARPGEATWSAAGADHINAAVHTDGHEVVLDHEIDVIGQLRASRFDRWGDPENTGTWQAHPFGVEVSGYGSFGGVTIPTRGRAGWHHGTPRWEDGIFFRFEITRYELLP